MSSPDVLQGRSTKYHPVLCVSRKQAMDVRSIAADALFRACFTGCPLDPKTLLLDVRAAKVFKRKHILQVRAYTS